ncbi:hypothetical protein HPB51_027952 [Rhipicephalus microplus]|uniref:Uncharacterized protein n=1 Tax=Rhipicephalus microplus TaxID=6941 RepID=A0A9J6CYD5_RHIMP|nr:hypothetical protein HPB51_027952 [Rhipicephalus microplus]
MKEAGHRTDVCPLPGPGIPKCRRCGGEHPPPPLGEQPTRTPQCVVCLGEHPTGSGSCKLRFTPVKPKQQEDIDVLQHHEGGRSKSAGRRSRSRSRKRSKSRNRNSSISAQKSCSPSQKTSASMPAMHNNKNA